jgi:hypothetical protein
MHQPSPKTPRTEAQNGGDPNGGDQNGGYQPGDQLEGNPPGVDRDDRTLKEVVETAATAYFSACRKIARTINRLKQS